MPVKNGTLKEYVLLLADEIEKAERIGSDKDSPEGTRYIQITDTLAKEIVKNIREKAFTHEGG